MEWNNHIYSADGLAVCFMAHSDGKDDERDEANAALVAAAPDLLAALELVWNKVLTEYHVKDSYVRQQVEAAMAKAAEQWAFLKAGE